MVCGIENTTILTGFNSEYMYTLNLSEFLHTEIVLTCMSTFICKCSLHLKKCDLHNNLIQIRNELIFKIPIILSHFKETNECAIYLPVNWFIVFKSLECLWFFIFFNVLKGEGGGYSLVLFTCTFINKLTAQCGVRGIFLSF